MFHDCDRTRFLYELFSGKIGEIIVDEIISFLSRLNDDTYEDRKSSIIVDTVNEFFWDLFIRVDFHVLDLLLKNSGFNVKNLSADNREVDKYELLECIILSAPFIYMLKTEIPEESKVGADILVFSVNHNIKSNIYLAKVSGIQAKQVFFSRDSRKCEGGNFSSDVLRKQIEKLENLFDDEGYIMFYSIEKKQDYKHGRKFDPRKIKIFKAKEIKIVMEKLGTFRKDTNVWVSPCDIILSLPSYGFGFHDFISQQLLTPIGLDINDLFERLKKKIDGDKEYLLIEIRRLLEQLIEKFRFVMKMKIKIVSFKKFVEIKRDRISRESHRVLEEIYEIIEELPKIFEDLHWIKNTANKLRKIINEYFLDWDIWKHFLLIKELTFMFNKLVENIKNDIKAFLMNFVRAIDPAIIVFVYQPVYNPE